MTQKKILEKLDHIEHDVHELKTSQKLMEKDINHLKTNHLFHIEKSTNLLWKWSLAIGVLIIIMFLDEAQNFILSYLGMQ